MKASTSANRRTQSLDSNRPHTFSFIFNTCSPAFQWRHFHLLILEYSQSVLILSLPVSTGTCGQCTNHLEQLVDRSLAFSYVEIYHTRALHGLSPRGRRSFRSYENGLFSWVSSGRFSTGEENVLRWFASPCENGRGDLLGRTRVTICWWAFPRLVARGTCTRVRLAIRICSHVERWVYSCSTLQPN